MKEVLTVQRKNCLPCSEKTRYRAAVKSAYRAHLNHLEVIFKIPRTISHTVAVLYQKKWFASIFVQIFPNFRKRWVHPAVHIQIAVIIRFIIITISCTLILCDTVWIKFLCPFQRLFKIATISTLIPH